jgi:membrane protein insertase Oxa1/YidC/SpoIIIJ
MNSFIIAFAGAIITRIESFIWSIIVCLFVVMILMYALFNIAGRYFQKEQLNYKEKTIDDSIKEVVKETKKKTNKKTTKRKKENKNV